MNYLPNVGEVKATVMYEVTDSAELIIDYSATTDRPTVISLSNHAFFNLDGHVSIQVSTTVASTSGIHKIDNIASLVNIKKKCI